jgi:hypothetical protein
LKRKRSKSACESILYLIIDFLVNKHRLGYASLVRLSKLLNFVGVGSDSCYLLHCFPCKTVPVVLSILFGSIKNVERKAKIV